MPVGGADRPSASGIGILFFASGLTASLTVDYHFDPRHRRMTGGQKLLYYLFPLIILIVCVAIYGFTSTDPKRLAPATVHNLENAERALLATVAVYAFILKYSDLS